MTSLPTRRAPGHQLNPDPTIRTLPNSDETVELLLADQDSLLRRRLAIFRPEELSDVEYRAAVAQAMEAEHGPRPLPWDEAGPEDRNPDDVVETLLLYVDFVDGDAVAREWWWERFHWLKGCHPAKARAVGRALDGRRGK